MDESRVLVVDRFKLMVSFVPKSMSSSLKNKLLEMLGERTRAFRNQDALLSSLHQNGVRFLRTYSPAEILWRRDTYYKVLFVRHPLRRVVSAYVDKMLQRNTLYYLLSSHFAWRVRGLSGMLHDPRNLFRKLTFQEFLLNILFYERRPSLDEHWKPAVDLALPCEMGFNFLGKVETAGKDLHCVFVEKLHQKSWFPTSNQHNSTLHYKTCIDQVPRPFLKRLIDLYADDFRAFNYDPLK